MNLPDKKLTFSIETLGCKVNQYESQVIFEKLCDAGYRKVPSMEAGLIVINSCTVTDQADKKTLKLLRRLKRHNPSARIIATGCRAVLDKDIEFLSSLSDIHKVVPNAKKTDIVNFLTDEGGIDAGTDISSQMVAGLDSHTRAFVKIQDGCDQACSYCKVTIVRGMSKSKSRQNIIDEIKHILDEGYSEIVLTGICLGSWKGAKGEDLADLLSEIVGIEKKFRVRLSSIEPNHVGSGLADVMAGSKKVCRHLHLPLQSGSDRVLSLMNRAYTSSDYGALISGLRDKMPLIGITADVIAGFPGETEDDFKKTLEFIGAVKPSRLHVFKYSPRKNTMAYTLPDRVDIKLAMSRARQIGLLGKGLERDFASSFLDKEVEVLIEERTKNSILSGYTGEYVKVSMTEACSEESVFKKVTPTDMEEIGSTLIVE